MSQPWYPASNPGGRNRETVRKTLAAYVDAQHIPGVTHVFEYRPTTYRFDDYPGLSGTNFAAMVGTVIGPTTEDRRAMTGPTDRGGKMITYPMSLELVHRTSVPDDAQNTSASEDDYDRIIDALCDVLRGPGRDLGRPEIVLTTGEWPRGAGIRFQPQPFQQERGSGAIVRRGMLMFNIEQYLVEYPQ